MKVAAITPRLEKRMQDQSIPDLKALAGLTKSPAVNYSTLADCVKGERRWTLNYALGVLKGLGYKLDSEELKLLEELSKQYVPKEDR